MPRMAAGKRMELESFWRAHLEGWRRSDLNQREYCELHGLPLKRFGNWRAKLKHEEPASAGKLLYRRGSGLRHMSRHMSKEIPSVRSSYIPSARSAPPGARRRFSAADKRRIVEEAERPGASVSGVARQYGITTRLLFRWKQELAPAAKTEASFLPVTITDAADEPAARNEFSRFELETLTGGAHFIRPYGRSPGIYGGLCGDALSNPASGSTPPSKTKRKVRVPKDRFNPVAAFSFFSCARGFRLRRWQRFLAGLVRYGLAEQ